MFSYIRKQQEYLDILGILRIPFIPEISKISGIPEIPEIPKITGISKIPGIPGISGIPEIPGILRYCSIACSAYGMHILKIALSGFTSLFF